MTYFINTNLMTFIKEFPCDEVDAEITRLELQHNAAWKEINTAYNRLSERNSNEDEAILVSYDIDRLRRRLVHLDNKLMAYCLLKENEEDEGPSLIRYPGAIRGIDPVSEIIFEQENGVVKEHGVDLWRERMEQEIEEEMKIRMLHW